VRVVDDAIEDRVCDGWFSEVVVPLSDRQLLAMTVDLAPCRSSMISSTSRRWMSVGGARPQSSAQVTSALVKHTKSPLDLLGTPEATLLG